MEAKNKQQKEKWLIDTDPGVDDAQAILNMLSPKANLDVIGISLIAGNSPMENVKINIAKVLEIAKREVPIYTGCETPLVKPLFKNDGIIPFHGWDGLGDAVDYKDMKGYTQCYQDTPSALAIL